MIDYVRLPQEKMKELLDRAKAGEWTPDQIWDAAKKMGQTATAKVSENAAKYAGRLYRGGRLILTGSKCFLGFSPLDFILDGLDYFNDPEGWRRKPALLFPGMLIVPLDYDDPFNPPMA